MEQPPDRPSSRPAFWDERFAQDGYLFGTRPDAFVAAQAARLPAGADVVELGAGEGRNLIYLARAGGHRVWAVDFAKEGLRKARQLAVQQGVALKTVEADVLSWSPQRQWDAVIITFLQLLPRQRPRLYCLVRGILRPGGYLIAQWFRPEHLTVAYARVGPSEADRMVPAEELRRHFREEEILLCEAADVDLNEGAVLQGHAAVVRLVACLSQA